MEIGLEFEEEQGLIKTRILDSQLVIVVRRRVRTTACARFCKLSLLVNYEIEEL